MTPTARAAFIYDLAPAGSFTLINTNADGSLIPLSNGFILIGGNNGNGDPGTTDYAATAVSSGTVNFNWSYSAADIPTFDFAGYLVSGNFFPLADTDGQSGDGMFMVSAGQTFGFRVGTADNTGEPGILTVTAASEASGIPEPSTASVVLLVMCLTIACQWRKWGRVRKLAGPVLGVVLAVAASPMFAQNQLQYVGTNATGQVTFTGTVNLSLQAQGGNFQPLRSLAPATPERTPKTPPKLLPPQPPFPVNLPAATGAANNTPVPRALSPRAVASQPLMKSIPIVPGSGALGFNGLSHYDQRNANHGNQYSVEPPSPAIAVSSNYVLEGVNNAVRVFSKSGTPLLNVLSTNQVFGLAPAINRATNISGVFPTDMRVFYDSGIDRWFIVQRAQCCDAAGNNVRRSQIYVAVSQTGDPTGNYNNYLIDTTDAQRTRCPCVADYPQLGADQYGFYISSNEYPIDLFGNPSVFPIGANILAISKAALASGAASPTTYKFFLPIATGYEFTIQPAATPPGGSNFIASGGLEYFVSNIATGQGGLSIWAMTNTSSLAGANPNLALIQIVVPVLAYSVPANALQPPGSIPYGASLIPPGLEPLIDTSDSRTLSVEYVAGRLYVAFGTAVQDENSRSLAGAAYVVFSPTFRGGLLSGNVVGQGYVLVKNNHLLRPAIGVNAQGRGAIVFTLVGPDYYPSAAYVSFAGFSGSTFSAGSAVQLAGPGVLPEDGFTGYPDLGFTSLGIARWGDYSGAVASGDGSIWMTTEYIPNAPRTQFANWGTFLIQYTP